MRQSRAQKEKSNQRIIEGAAKAIRGQGMAGTSIAPLMAEAGMTHGGFYRHFKSKDDLLVVALNQASLEAMEELFDANDKGSLQNTMERITSKYLSDRHIDAPAAGCPLPATGADVSRSSPKIRQAYTQSVNRMLDALSGNGEVANIEARRSAARELALMVGAVMIARACDRDGSRKFRELIRSGDLPQAT